MPIIQPTAAAYARMIKALLPPGRVLRQDTDSVVHALALASADELVRVSGRAADLIEEADPRTTSELLPDFERELDLASTGTDDERRSRIVARTITRSRFRPADFQTVLAPILGLDPADVVVIENSRADAIATGEDRDIYKFYIYRNPSLPGSYNLTDAQDMINRMKPSHTEGHIIESDDFLCDDPYSLCDRDILGV